MRSISQRRERSVILREKRVVVEGLIDRALEYITRFTS